MHGETASCERFTRLLVFVVFFAEAAENGWTSQSSRPEAFAAAHVRNTMMRTKVASTAYDELSAAGALKRLSHAALR